MAKYTLIDPVTGKRWFPTETMLTQNLQLNCILLQDEEHLGIITHRDLVAFSRWCAGKILARLKDEPDLRVTHALTLVDRWLENQQSVTPEELEAARNAAWDVWVAESAVWELAEYSATIAESTILTVVRAADATAEVAWVAAWVAENAQSARISYEAQVQWFVEHLRSGK